MWERKETHTEETPGVGGGRMGKGGCEEERNDFDLQMFSLGK